MKAETATAILKREINFLKQKRSDEYKDLKEQLYVTFESLKPINLLKNTFKDVTKSPDIQSGLWRTAIGMFSGFFLKKIVFRSSINPIKILAGVAFQAWTTNLASKNAGKIKHAGVSIFEMLKDLLKAKKKEDVHGYIS